MFLYGFPCRNSHGSQIVHWHAKYFHYPGGPQGTSPLADAA